MSPWARSATCKPCPMVLVPDSTVHCSRHRCCSGRDSCMLTSRCMLPWLRSAHTCLVHNTYPTLKPRLVFSPLKPRLVEHTAHGHTRRLLFWDVAIRNSLRSNILEVIYTWYILFERSEFLIATCKKKKTDRLSVCPDVRIISWF